MSWSTSKIVDSAEAVDAIELDLDFGDKSDPVLEQLTVAKAAAKAVIESGAVGSGKRYSVSLSGHANPGHEPKPGWANDCVTVNVVQIV